MDLNLENKVFFIAGSTQGIGLGIAKCFLAEGARVAITGRNKERLEVVRVALSQEFGADKILALNGDMQNSASINQLLDVVSKKFGQIDGAIANIGSGSEPSGVPTNPEIWDTSFDINLKSSMLLVQSALPYLNVKKSSIIFISSIAGVEDIKAPLAYSMHKAALIAASKKLSRQLASLNIRVNVVAPGNIIFPDGSWAKKQENNMLEVNAYIASEVPLNCFGTPEDIGNICTFLSSEKAKFITGSMIIVDGGQTRSF